MKTCDRKGIIGTLLAASWLCAFPALAQQNAAPIPGEKIAELQNALAATKDGDSAARKRLAVKRTIRDADDLLEAGPAAPNRFEVLGILFRARQQLLGIDGSPENREAFLKTCEQLAAAPDEYAAIRLDADLLLSQARMAKLGVDASQRAAALIPLVERYHDTAVEAKVLKVAMVMALEFGDIRVVDKLRATMEERFAGDLEMITFQREKLGGQVFGAPFCGNFETSDGGLMRFPMDCMGRSTFLYFWSKDNNGEEDLKQLVSAWRERKDEFAGRIGMVSINLDDLPDAGGAMLRGLGVDWPALRLPGGRENPVYQAYGRSDPALVTVSPTGYAALIMSGTMRRPSQPSEVRDYTKGLGSALAREWTKPDILGQLCALFAGEFLVVDCDADFDPARPAELRMLSGSGHVERNGSCVSEADLRAIQSCFIPPPLRYSLAFGEAKTNFERAVKLCREAIASHPQASDLWMVRNRMIVAMLALWKLEPAGTHFAQAVAESKAALTANPPPGTDVIPRFCLARQSLRTADATAKDVIAGFLGELAAHSRSGPALAAASLLALDGGDRILHEHYRRSLLDHHADAPAMGTMVAFLMDRYHRYHLYQEPFSAGWTPGKREGYFLSRGDAEDARRTFNGEFQELGGGMIRIPGDTAGKWTVILFAAPWAKDGPPSPDRSIAALLDYAAWRPSHDIEVVLAVLDDDKSKVEALLAEKPLDCRVVLVPGGLRNPIAGRLGMLAAETSHNALVLAPDGHIAAFLSGLVMKKKAGREVVENIISWHDARNISAALGKGDLDEAKRIALALTAAEEPVQLDKKGRPVKRSKRPTNVHHLLASAKVHMAAKDWTAALADAEQAVSELTAEAGGLSLRTAELDEAAELRDAILKSRGKTDLKE